MLPAPPQFIVTMVAYAMNQRMGRRGDYQQEAAATGSKRMEFSSQQRSRLTRKGKELAAEEPPACGQIVRPATILGWFRRLTAQRYDSTWRAWVL